VRFSHAGYGNATENPNNDTISSKYADHTSGHGEVISTVNNPSEVKAETRQKEKTKPEVKEARKKMREGDQDAVRDYTASID